MNTRLCIFTRVPRLGAVKSRLAASLGAQGAYDAHCALVEHALGKLAHVTGVPAALWLDDQTEYQVDRWSARWGIPLRMQDGRDLGERMEHALLDCLATGCAGIVVGTDCPPIDAAYVLRAARALELHDLVLGPAADGGYGLIGLSQPVAHLFAGVQWGAASVLAATLANATRQRMRICLLPQIWDVDTPADWERWLRERETPVER